MSQQIKKKYLGDDSVGSDQILLEEGSALRIVSGQTEVELLKLGQAGEVLVKGDEVALQSALDTEESARIAADGVLDGRLDLLEPKVGTLEGEMDQAQGDIVSLDGRLDVVQGADNVAGSIAKAEKDAKAYADQKVSDLVNSAPAVLDTLKELSDALGGDENFSATVASQIGGLDGRIDTLEANDQTAGSVDYKVKQAVDGLASNITSAIAGLDTDDIAEGTSNKYYTDARAQAAITGGASSIVTADLTAAKALVSDAQGKVGVSAVTSQELGYMSGVTSAVQTQLGGKASQALDNLASTSISQNLLPSASGAASLGTSNKFWDAFAGISHQAYRQVTGFAGAFWAMSSGEAFDGDDYAMGDLGVRAVKPLLIYSESAANSSRLGMRTGDSSSNSGAIKLYTGQATTASGSITLKTGLSNGTRGKVVVDALEMDMSSKKIVNLADPTSAQHAATKKYVDDKESALDIRLDILEGADNIVDSVSYKIKQAVNSLVNGAPEAYDTLKEIADYISSDGSAAASMTSQLNDHETRLDTLEGTGVGSYQYADTQLSTSLTNAINSAINQEVSDRNTAISSAIATEVADRNTAIGVLDADLQGQIDGHEGRIDALEAATDGPQFYKQKVILGSGDLTYIDLNHEAIENSIVLAVGRLMGHKDDDYTVSVVGGKTRITWYGSFAQPNGVEAVDVGDVVFVTYAVLA